MELPVSPDERTASDLRREIAEAQALAARTHAAVTTLTATLKDLVTRQDRYERGLNLNSFVAYVLFTVLLGTGFYLLYRSRAEALVGDRDAALRARGEAVAGAAAARAELEEREAGARKAAELWALLQEGRRSDLIARMPELAGARVSPVERQVLEQGALRARAELVDASFAAGLDAAKAQQWKRAATELSRALTFEDQGPRAIQMRYHYGVALLKQGDAEEALKQLEAALAGGEKVGGPEARFHLAAALEATKQLDRARAEYVAFSQGNWYHPLAPVARRRAAEILRAQRAPAPPAAQP
jgi:TolA-binding protein